MTTFATAFRSHPDRSTLAAFAQASPSGPETRTVEEHLRAGCLRCLLALRDLFPQVSESPRSWSGRFLGEAPSGPDDGVERYVLRVERKALLVEAEKAVSPALMAELMLRPPSGRRVLVRESRKYQLLGLSEILREESLREIFRDVARALELAELAGEVADCLSTDFYGPRLVADAQALAWAAIGNSRRVAGDFFGAERSFQTALDFLERGTGSPTEEADVLSLLASLRTEQAQFKEAVRLLDQAARTYRDLGLQNREGRAIFQLGHTAVAANEPERALEFFRSALDLLDPDEDSKLILWAHHNIAACLSDSGAHEDAQQYLEGITPLYLECSDDRAVLVRRRWLEGRIAAGQDRLDEAKAILGEVRSLFVEEERAYDHALVSLDLATVYLETGKIDEVKRLVRGLYPVFRSQDIHREAVAALLLFERAVTAETATVALAKDVARYLNRARNNPYLRYEPSTLARD